VVFWDVTSCYLVKRFLRFVWTSYFHLQNRKFCLKMEAVASSESLATLYHTMFHIPGNGNFKKPCHWNLQMSQHCLLQVQQSEKKEVFLRTPFPWLLIKVCTELRLCLYFIMAPITVINHRYTALPKRGKQFRTYLSFISLLCIIVFYFESQNTPISCTSCTQDNWEGYCLLARSI
jgi:hypothetical protein